MNFSDHFHRVHEIAGALPEEARILLRAAEEHSSPTIALHWCLCAESWLNALHDADNARCCLLYAEALMWNDVRELLILTECWLILFADTKAARRCLKRHYILPHRKMTICASENSSRSSVYLTEICCRNRNHVEISRQQGNL